MGARRSGAGAPHAARSRMGAIMIRYEDGHPLYADNPRGGNRSSRRHAAGISREVPQ